jgi:hypothetical protein
MGRIIFTRLLLSPVIKPSTIQRKFGRHLFKHLDIAIDSCVPVRTRKLAYGPEHMNETIKLLETTLHLANKKPNPIVPCAILPQPL